MNIISFKTSLLLIIVYFSCNSFVLAVKYAGKTVPIMISVGLVTILVSLLKGRYFIPRNAKLIVVLLAVNIMLTALFNGYMNAYFLLIMIFLMCLSCIKLYSRQEFFENYITIMKILSFFAVVVGLVNTLSPSLLSIFPLYGLSSSGTFTHYYRDVLLAFQAVALTRINSIWGEPGMFSVFLTFALLFELFYVRRKINFFTVFLFIVADVLCFSTAGLICLAITLSALLFREDYQNRNNIGILSIVFTIILIVFVGKRFSFISEQFVGSLGKLNSDDISFIGRVAPILYNLVQGFKSPLVGHGIQGGSFFVNFSFYSGYLACNTSTTTFLFSSFGILFCAITVVLSWKLAKLSGQNRKCVALLFVVLILNVNSQAVHLDQIYYIILFSVFMFDDTVYKRSAHLEGKNEDSVVLNNTAI